MAVALAGCEASGEPSGSRTFSDEDVPFEFDVPSDFTDAPVDRANSAGRVVAGVGVSKVDVIAVRRGRVVEGPREHEVLGHDVTSEVFAVPGHEGWVIECQYTSERREKVLDACDEARRTVK